MKRILDERPARPLTSREINKVLGGVVGSLAEWCEREDIWAALEFFLAHKDEYNTMFDMIQSGGSKS